MPTEKSHVSPHISFARALRPSSAVERLILAVDTPDIAAARALIAATNGHVGVYKIGFELIYTGGLSLVPELHAAGAKVFIDAKLLDIDNTVAAAVRALAVRGADFATVHAYPQTMRAAVAAQRALDGERPSLLAVTVLTNFDASSLQEAGYELGLEQLVEMRAVAAMAAGMTGIVSSALEAAALRARIGPDPLIVTPGIRPPGSARGDQRRTMTPGEAIAAGADYLVVGRPIARAADPASAAQDILEDMDRALS